MKQNFSHIMHFLDIFTYFHILNLISDTHLKILPIYLIIFLHLFKYINVPSHFLAFCQHKSFQFMMKLFSLFCIYCFVSEFYLWVTERTLTNQCLSTQVILYLYLLLIIHFTCILIDYVLHFQIVMEIIQMKLIQNYISNLGVSECHYILSPQFQYIQFRHNIIQRMPPKPWETRKKPVQNISQIIQSNPTVKQQVPKLPPTETSASALSSSTSPSSGLAGASSYGGYGGYGSSGYGGGYGGGYSSYGMGGMGSMGMGMGMGGMYGYGRYGLMGGGQNQKGALYNTMMTLDSFSYLINCLCEIARSLDQNYEGLSLFYKSFKNLINRLQSGVFNGCKWVVDKIKNFFKAIYRFIVQNIFFMGRNQNKQKYKALRVVITVALIALAVSLYPLIRKAIKSI